jgi:hypothetical protein
MSDTQGIADDPQQESALREDLYEAYRHIEGLCRRFPQVRDAVAPNLVAG